MFNYNNALFFLLFLCIILDIKIFQQSMVICLTLHVSEIKLDMIFLCCNCNNDIYLICFWESDLMFLHQLCLFHFLPAVCSETRISYSICYKSSLHTYHSTYHKRALKIHFNWWWEDNDHFIDLFNWNMKITTLVSRWCRYMHNFGFQHNYYLPVDISNDYHQMCFLNKIVLYGDPYTWMLYYIIGYIK